MYILHFLIFVFCCVKVASSPVEMIFSARERFRHPLSSSAGSSSSYTPPSHHSHQSHPAPAHLSHPALAQQRSHSARVSNPSASTRKTGFSGSGSGSDGSTSNSDYSRDSPNPAENTGLRNVSSSPVIVSVSGGGSVLKYKFVITGQ